MKSLFKQLISLGSSFGLLTVCLSVSLPVAAALPCEYGTISRYQNGGIASCTIRNNIYVRMGSLAFPCLQGHYVSFDEKGQFTSCVISQEVKVRAGQIIETCPAEYRVYVSSFSNGNQSVICQQI